MRGNQSGHPAAHSLAQGEPERLREILPLVEARFRDVKLQGDFTTSHSGAERVPSTDSSGDGASRMGDSNGGAPSRRADSNGGGPSKLDDANTDSRASGDASRWVQLSSACFLLPIVRPLAQPGSMALPRARIGPRPLPKRS